MAETLEVIHECFPEYGDRTLSPIFSSLSIPDEIAKYLTRKRIYGMEMKDDTMEIVNFEKFDSAM